MNAATIKQSLAKQSRELKATLRAEDLTKINAHEANIARIAELEAAMQIIVELNRGTGWKDDIAEIARAALKGQR